MESSAELAEKDEHGKRITSKENVTLLGLNINKHIDWNWHILLAPKSLKKMLQTRINSMRITTRHFSMAAKLTIANGIFMSTLTYMINVWGMGRKSDIMKIQVLQNQIARYVTGDALRTNTETVLKKCSWLCVNQLICLHSLCLMWKVVHRGSLGALRQCIEITESRTLGKLRVRSIYINLACKSWEHYACMWWNRIPESIKMSQSITSFKSQLTPWIATNIAVRRRR